MQHLTVVRRALAAAVALTCLAFVTGCGEEGVEVSEELSSTPGQKFALVDEDGKPFVVGHGVVLQVPEDWTDYEPETESIDGSTMEWAVGQPEPTEPLPAGLQFSMGVAGKGGQVDSETGLAEAAKKIAEISPGYELIDEGEADVPGAKVAKFLRFKRDLAYGDTVVPVEQLTLMIQVAEDTSSTIRFIAPEGQWDALMKKTYDSVKVTDG